MIGDSVRIEQGKTTSVVDAIIKSEQQMTDWGLKAPMVMIKAQPFGLVAWSPYDEDDPVQFVSRYPH